MADVIELLQVLPFNITTSAPIVQSLFCLAIGSDLNCTAQYQADLAAFAKQVSLGLAPATSKASDNASTICVAVAITLAVTWILGVVVLCVGAVVKDRGLFGSRTQEEVGKRESWASATTASSRGSLVGNGMRDRSRETLEVGARES